MLPECSQAFPFPVISLHKFIICLVCNQMENRRKTMKKANKYKTYRQNTMKRNRPCPQQRTSRTPRCRCPASLVTEHHFVICFFASYFIFCQLIFFCFSYYSFQQYFKSIMINIPPIVLNWCICFV